MSTAELDLESVDLPFAVVDLTTVASVFAVALVYAVPVSVAVVVAIV